MLVKFPHKTTYFHSFSKQQHSAIGVVTYHIMPVTNMLRKSNIRFYIGKLKTIVLTFSVPKSQNSNEEEKNSITDKAYP